jgi:hypothetical protein
MTLGPTVEDEAGGAVRLLDAVSDDTHYDLVGDQPAGLHHRLSGQPNRGSGPGAVRWSTNQTCVVRRLPGNRPSSLYRFPRRALTLCPQLCLGIQPVARFPARSADATLYGHFTKAIHRNRPINESCSQAVNKLDSRSIWVHTSPASEPAATAARSISPVESCGVPSVSMILGAWDPLL